MSGAAGVQLNGVRKTFEADEGSVEAIAEISGDVPDGRFVSIVGPSGCGKTTLLDIVAGLEAASEGEVLIDGTPVTGPRRDLAVVFQGDSTLHWRTVIDNVSFGLELQHVGREERTRRSKELVDLVGLTGFEQHRPAQLSGGMRQRVAIARALVLDPRVLLMDEPFGALDQQTRGYIGQELVRIWEETRKTVLFITHDLAEACFLSDEVWVLTARPARLKQRVEIDLPRPRRPEILRSPEFHRHVDLLGQMVSDEVEAQREQTRMRVAEAAR